MLVADKPEPECDHSKMSSTFWATIHNVWFRETYVLDKKGQWSRKLGYGWNSINQFMIHGRLYDAQPYYWVFSTEFNRRNTQRGDSGCEFALFCVAWDQTATSLTRILGCQFRTMAYKSRVSFATWLTTHLIGRLPAMRSNLGPKSPSIAKSLKQRDSAAWNSSAIQGW